MVNHFQKLKRSEGEQNILLEQLRNYKLRNSSYNPPFSFESGNEENSVSDDISESESDFYEVEPNYKIDKKNNFVLEEIIDLNNSIFTDGN
ncbi:12866_t:CDS:2 [Entrophospora sp. SA101]|nr:12866_t:CDS:2 [Entrophospora sp. SA101]